MPLMLKLRSRCRYSLFLTQRRMTHLALASTYTDHLGNQKHALIAPWRRTPAANMNAREMIHWLAHDCGIDAPRELNADRS